MMNARVFVLVVAVAVLAATMRPAGAQHLPMPVENQSSEGTIQKKKAPDLTGDVPTPQPSVKPAAHAKPASGAPHAKPSTSPTHA